MCPTHEPLSPSTNKEVAPPQLALFGIAAIAIRSAPLMFPSSKVYLILAWDPTRRAGMRNAPGAGAGVAIALLVGPPAGRAQVSQFAEILV